MRETKLMIRSFVLFICVMLLRVEVVSAQEGTWTTAADRSRLLTYEALPQPVDTQPSVILDVDISKSFQSIAGFGGTLTDGSVSVINRLESQQRSTTLDTLFQNDNDGAGISMLRISVGASDLSDRPYTYNDSDEPDPSLAKFDMKVARESLIPMLLEIKKRNPSLKLMATPWSAPTWMKDNRSFVGGSLQPAYYESYARYLVRYLQEFEKSELPIEYLTVQNEPENDHNNPSMLMTAQQQANFIGRFLGPALKKSGLQTKILAFDHNCDHPDYPIAVLRDSAAHRFVAGSAFHLYAGDISAMSRVYDAFPNKELHFTEQWVSSEGDFGGDLMWHAENVLIGALQNHASSVLEWNIAADDNQQPHTEGGCDKCLGAITVTANEVRRNVAFYIIGHASKFIPLNSVRVQSKSTSQLPNVAVLTPDRRLVVLLLNKSPESKLVAVRSGKQSFQFQLSPRVLSHLCRPSSSNPALTLLVQEMKNL